MFTSDFGMKKRCDRSDFHCGMVVGARWDWVILVFQKLRKSPGNFTHNSMYVEFTQNGSKETKHIE